MDQTKIGKFIADCRKKKKMTQSELAYKLGVTDKSVSNWENGRNMPDLSLFKPLCELLNISINDLISGEIVAEKEYKNKLEENIINTIEYTNKKVLEKNKIIEIILLVFGLLIIITAMTIFPSESSWGSIYSIFGTIISLIGFSKLINKFNYKVKILFNLGYFIILIGIIFLIDYISVINIKQAPRFSIYKITSENEVYYDTLFYDVVRCNRDTSIEYYKILKNNNYDKDNINIYCK